MKGTPYLLVALLMGLALLAGCRPQAIEGDPVNLHWDEDAKNGFTKLLKLKSVDGVRVVFWNIGYGALNRGGDLDHNLKDLVNSSAHPDVIVLAEYKEMALNQGTIRFLDTEYPHQAYFPYGGTLDEVGIKVWSEQPFTQSEAVMLDWSPTRESSIEQDLYKQDWVTRAPKQSKWWDRPYSRFRWDIAGYRMNLVPVHLLEPWDKIYERKGDWETWKDMMFGRDNPLYYSVERLMEKMRADLGGDLDSEPLLVIGDINVPRKVFQIRTKVYERIDDELDDVFPGDPSSFPAFSSPLRQEPPFKYSMVKLDHAFHNKLVRPRGAAVLPLRGSDHYPIYVVVEPLSRKK